MLFTNHPLHAETIQKCEDDRLRVSIIFMAEEKNVDRAGVLKPVGIASPDCDVSNLFRLL